MQGTAERRIKFDFEIEFSNGGGLSGRDFRLDIAGDDIDEAELMRYVVRDLRLLMVGRVTIRNREIITEPHKRAKPVAGARSVVDLSHTIDHGMTTYPGIPGPLMCDFLSRDQAVGKYAEGVTFQIGRIDMVANTGTYIDTPFHRYEHGEDLATVGIGSLVGLPACVVRAPHEDRLAIDNRSFRDLDCFGKAVLVHTGWDSKWRTEGYLSGHPFLTGDAAELLRARGAVLVGIDSLNIDDMHDPARPVHSNLLGAGIPIVEHLRGLAQLPESGALFTANPVKISRMGSFPVRAFATLGNASRE